MSSPLLSKPNTPSLAGCSVLVVEDNYYVGEELATMLRRHGAHVLGPVADVMHGRALLASAKPACAVLDTSLRSGPVFDLAEELQERGIPPIFATGQDSSLLPPRLRDVPYLQKPVHAPQLVELVRLARDRASGHPVAECLIRRFERATPLPPRDRKLLEAVTSSVSLFGPHEDLARGCSPSKHILLLTEGFACRYRRLPDGRRQITALILPGDLCHVDTPALRHRDHAITSISRAGITLLTPDAVERLQTRPALAAALAWDAMQQQSIAREWLVNIGRRTAFERLGHFICEMVARLQTVGLAQDDGCYLPLTQGDLADALALTPVHVNRTLMELRRRGLVSLQNRRLVIPDPTRLCELVGFDRSYLDP